MIEIEVSRELPSEHVKRMGYKETKVIWLSAEIMMFSNNEVPINEDIALALDLIPELVRQARVDRNIDELLVWMKKRQEKSLYRRHADFKGGCYIYDKRRMD